MPDNEKEKPADAFLDVVEEDIFIEWINIKYGVAKPIIREVVSRVGKNLPRIFNELRKLGYPVPPEEL